MARYGSVVIGIAIAGSCSIGAVARAETETIFQTVNGYAADVHACVGAGDNGD